MNKKANAYNFQKKKTYRKMLKNDSIQQSTDGIKNTNVDTIAE